MIIKKVNPCQYEELESISRFLHNVEYRSSYYNSRSDNHFWYEVACYGSGIDDLWQTDAMQKIIPDLQSGKAKLAICYLREIPFGHDAHVVMQSKIGKDAVEKYNIDPKLIYYFYNSIPDHLTDLFDYPINVIAVPYFEIDFVHRYNQNTDFCTAGHPMKPGYSCKYNLGPAVCNEGEAMAKKPQRTFLDMNGKPDKYMRLRHVVHLWNKRLIDNGIINLLRTDEDIRRFPDKNDYYDTVKDIINEKDWKKFCEWWPQTFDDADVGQNYGKHYSGYPFDKKLFLDTFMSVVSETHSGAHNCNPEFFITEKIVRAIGNCHPFIVLSTPNYLSELKLLGYKTFEPYVNESYDSEENTELRMVKAIDSVKEVCDKGVPVECINIAIHNQQNLINRYNDTMKMLEGIFND